MTATSIGNSAWRGMLILAAGLLAASPSTAIQAAPDNLSDFVLKSADLNRGMCLNLNDVDGKLTIALVEAGGLCVQGCTWDARTIPACRAAIAASGKADRASVIAIDSPGLPYADDLINLVVCASWDDKTVAVEEIVRVLVPGGQALLGNDANPTAVANLEEKLKRAGMKDIAALARHGWLRFVKPIDPGMDAWTHRLGSADISSVNDDKRVGPWSEARWIGEPRWGSLYISYQARVTGGGRLYYKENRAAVGGGTQNWLVARDAYNGFELWRVPSGAPFSKSFYLLDDSLTCDEKDVYCVEENKLIGRDGRTGETIRTYEPGFVPTMVTAAGNVLLVSTKSQTAAMDQRRGKAVSKGRAAAVDKRTGEVVWSMPAATHPAADHAGVYVLDGTELQKIDLATGESCWKSSASSASGMPQVFCKGNIVYVSYKPTWTPMTLLAAHDATDGKPLWKQDAPKGGYGVLPYQDEIILLDRNNALRSDNVHVQSLNARTGLVTREYQATGLVGGHCFTAKGCGNFLVYSNSWYLDRESGNTFEPNTVRAPCRLGQMAANGLTYFLPQHCDCKVFLRGFLAMAPAGKKNWLTEVDTETIPQPTTIAAAPPPLAEQPKDWPIYRHDTRRSNATTAQLPEKLQPLWTETIAGSRLTQAVAAYGVVCVAESRTGHVFARDAETGKSRWSYHADGRVDFPPSLHQGLCLFGTSAGSVIALDALTGAEIWRLRAAPAEKYIAEEGRFASAWPVVGGVMPMGDDVYFNCGRAAHVDGGIHLFAVHAATGKVRWRTPGGSSADLFAGDGENLMLTRTFYRTKDGNRILGAKKSTGLLHTTEYLSPVSVLDYMASVEPALTSKRHVDLTDGRITGEALAFTENFGIAAWRYRFGVPAAIMKNDRPNERFLYATADRKVRWLIDTDIRRQMVAVVLSEETAYMAGVPTSRDPKEKSELWVLNGKDGTKRQTLVLDTIPAYDGLSIADERLYLAGEDGKLLCFGAR